MNYEQLWKGLKAKYEWLADKSKTKIKNAEGKPVANELESLNRKSDEALYDVCDTVLGDMAMLENAQTKSRRELIEATLDELRRDRLFERYHIKRIEFGFGVKGTFNYQYTSIEKYYDYHLYENGCNWLIVFYNNGEAVTYITFKNVEIVYWDNKKGK